MLGYHEWYEPVHRGSDPQQKWQNKLIKALVLQLWYSSFVLFILCDFSFSAGDFAEPEHDRNDFGLPIQGAGSDDAAAADFNCVVFPSNCRPRAKL